LGAAHFLPAIDTTDNTTVVSSGHSSSRHADVSTGLRTIVYNLPLEIAHYFHHNSIMESKHPQDRAPSRRLPLGDATRRVNNSQKPAQQQYSQGSPTSRIPHHESLKPDGILQTMDPSPSPTRDSPPKVVAENKRLSAVTRDSHPNSNRDSQISTTSTASGGKSRRKTHVGPWQLGKTLGKGATGRVRLAKHAVTGQTAAIKIVSKKSAALVQSASMANMDETLTAVAITGNSSGTRLMPFGIEREVVIMKLIEHPNIINLYDVWENRGELYGLSKLVTLLWC
jgi:serine/threonine-protein kinase HSL1 (negative regulator of Swe1 kinase)